MDFGRIRHNSVGVALLVSNDYKTLGKDAELGSTHSDAFKMEEVFEEFGYVVYRMQNIRSEDFTSYCKEIAGFQYPQNCRRILVYFSGHGDDGTLVMQDGGDLIIESIIELFKPDVANNAVLTEMAKMFFFDACRGGKEDHGYNTARGGVRNKAGNEITFLKRLVLPREGNVFVAYASTRHYCAYETSAGGRWTTCLIKALKESKVTDTLEAIIKRANILLAEDQQHHGSCFQTAESMSSLRIDVFFKKEAEAKGYAAAGSGSGHTFDCSTVATMLQHSYQELGNLSYSSMRPGLIAKDVITLQEKRQINNLIGEQQIEAVLDIVISSLRAGQTAKYRGLLIAMEESGDILLKQKAEELGGSHSVPM